MAERDFSTSSWNCNSTGKRPSEDAAENTTWSTLTGSTDRVNWSTTSSTYHVSLDDCGPTEYIFIFYAYYYGLMVLVTVIAVAGNTAVIRAVVRHPKLRQPGNYFIVSLACSDLVLSLIYPVYNLAHLELQQIQDVLGDWMFCTSIITVYLGLQSISAYGLVGIAVTRYISIREPLLFNERVTHCRALAAAAALWIILLVTSAALYFRLTPDESYNGICRYELFEKERHILLTCLLSVVIPLLVMGVLYGLMATEARKQVIAVAHVRLSFRRSPNATRRYVIKKELKMIAVAGILLGYFAFAWIPFVAYEFYTIHCAATHALWESCESNCYIRATVRLLLHTNSAINYFIYASRVKDFREAFRRDHVLLRCRRPSLTSHGSAATFTSFAGSFSTAEHIRLSTFRHDDQPLANGAHYSRSHRPSIV